MNNLFLIFAGTLALIGVAQRWTDFIDAWTEPSMIVVTKVLLHLSLATLGCYAVKKGVRG